MQSLLFVQKRVNALRHSQVFKIEMAFFFFFFFPPQTVGKREQNSCLCAGVAGSQGSSWLVTGHRHCLTDIPHFSNGISPLPRTILPSGSKVKWCFMPNSQDVFQHCLFPGVPIRRCPHQPAITMAALNSNRRNFPGHAGTGQLGFMEGWICCASPLLIHDDTFEMPRVIQVWAWTHLASLLLLLRLTALLFFADIPNSSVLLFTQPLQNLSMICC